MLAHLIKFLPHWFYNGQCSQFLTKGMVAQDQNPELPNLTPNSREASNSTQIHSFLILLPLYLGGVNLAQKT